MWVITHHFPPEAIKNEKRIKKFATSSVHHDHQSVLTTEGEGFFVLSEYGKSKALPHIPV